MAVIKAKTVIKAGTDAVYNTATFSKYVRENIIEVKTPEEMLDLFKDDKILWMDTEDKPIMGWTDNNVPKGVIRRWIGTGAKAKPVDIPFCVSIGNGTIFASMYDDDFENGCPKIQKLKSLFEDPTVDKVFHNVRFDYTMLKNIGIRLGGKWHDTMVLTKLMNENRPNFTLRSLAEPHGGIIDFEDMVDLYKKINKVVDYSKIPRELMTQYAGADIFNCWKVWDAEWPLLQAESELATLYENEMAVIRIAADMEETGMRADLRYERTLVDTLTQAANDAERSVYAEAGKIFNMNSGAQVHKILTELDTESKLKFEYSDKGNVVMDKIQMEKFEKQGVSIVRKILNFKKTSKLLGTYAKGIYSQVGKDEHVHASINTGEAVTGRMSITKPALQTLPKKNTSIRNIFIPEDGCDLYSMDLDQVELRLYYHYANDAAMCQMIKDGFDGHTATASLLFSVPLDSVTSEQRSLAKTINFALIYGVGVTHLAELLDTTVSEASKIKSDYFRAIPTSKPFIDNVQQVTRQRGYIRNHYGRRRRLSSNDAFKAPNALIQGCAADYIKYKAVRLYKYILMHNLKTKMLIPIHDEIIFNVPHDETEHLAAMRWLLSDFETFRTDITAGVERMDGRWGDKIDINEETGFKPLTKEEVDAIDAYDIWERGM